MTSKSFKKSRVVKLAGVAIESDQCHLLSELDDSKNDDVIDRRSKLIVTLNSDEFTSLRKKFESGGRILKSVTGNLSNQKNDLKLPLVREMQKNERKFAEKMKIQREKNSVKKLKRKEKELKTVSERKRMKEKAELQKLFDKIVAKKNVKSESEKASKLKKTDTDFGVSKRLNFTEFPNDVEKERGEGASENDVKGRLYPIPRSENIGENDIVLQNSHGLDTQRGHIDPKRERASSMKEKLAFFGQVSKKK